MPAQLEHKEGWVRPRMIRIMNESEEKEEEEEEARDTFGRVYHSAETSGQ